MVGISLEKALGWSSAQCCSSSSALLPNMIESRKAEKNKTNEQRNAREIVILLLLSELNYAFQHEPLRLNTLFKKSNFGPIIQF